MSAFIILFFLRFIVEKKVDFVSECISIYTFVMLHDEAASAGRYIWTSIIDMECF